MSARFIRICWHANSQREIIVLPAIADVFLPTADLLLATADVLLATSSGPLATSSALLATSSALLSDQQRSSGDQQRSSADQQWSPGDQQRSSGDAELAFHEGKPLFADCNRAKSLPIGRMITGRSNPRAGNRLPSFNKRLFWPPYHLLNADEFSQSGLRRLRSRHKMQSICEIGLKIRHKPC